MTLMVGLRGTFGVVLVHHFPCDPALSLPGLKEFLSVCSVELSQIAAF